MLILYSHPHTLTICTQYSFHVPIYYVNIIIFEIRKLNNYVVTYIRFIEIIVFAYAIHI